MCVGKTTLADLLVASNGIISPRQAGKVNFESLDKVKFIHFIVRSYDTWIAERMNSFVESQ